MLNIIGTEWHRYCTECCDLPINKCVCPVLHEIEFALIVQEHKESWERAKLDIGESVRVAKDCGRKRKRETVEKHMQILPVKTICEELGLIGECYICFSFVT